MIGVGNIKLRKIKRKFEKKLTSMLKLDIFPNFVATNGGKDEMFNVHGVKLK